MLAQPSDYDTLQIIIGDLVRGTNVSELLFRQGVGDALYEANAKSQMVVTLCFTRRGGVDCAVFEQAGPGIDGRFKPNRRFWRRSLRSYQCGKDQSAYHSLAVILGVKSQRIVTSLALNLNGGVFDIIVFLEPCRHGRANSFEVCSLRKFDMG